MDVTVFAKLTADFWLLSSIFSLALWSGRPRDTSQPILLETARVAMRLLFLGPYAFRRALVLLALAGLAVSSTPTLSDMTSSEWGVKRLVCFVLAFAVVSAGRMMGVEEDSATGDLRQKLLHSDAILYDYDVSSYEGET